jgi:hypothetical protein
MYVKLRTNAMFLSILGIQFLKSDNRRTGSLSPSYHSLAMTKPVGFDCVVCPFGLFITSNEQLSLTKTKTDTLTILKYETVYLWPSLAITQHVGRGKEMATIFHNATKKLPIFPHNIPFLAVLVNFLHFRRI